MKDALWDEQRFHLRIALAAPRAVASNTVIEEEQGRWVVYLEVGFWEAAGASESPIEVTRRRIKDYPTRRDAEVAASGYSVRRTGMLHVHERIVRFD